MKLTLQLPMGKITATITGGAVGSAEVTPEGGAIFQFFPVDETKPDEEVFIGD